MLLVTFDCGDWLEGLIDGSLGNWSLGVFGVDGKDNAESLFAEDAFSRAALLVIVIWRTGGVFILGLIHW